MVRAGIEASWATRTVPSQNRSHRRLKSFPSPRSYAQALLSLLRKGLEQEDFKTFSYIMRQIAVLLKAPDWQDSRAERQRLTFIKSCKCRKIFLGQTLYESVLAPLVFRVRGRGTSPSHAGGRARAPHTSASPHTSLQLKAFLLRAHTHLAFAAV